MFVFPHPSHPPPLPLRIYPLLNTQQAVQVEAEGMRLRHEAAARRQAQQRVAFPIRLFHRVVVSGVVGRGQEEALRNCGVKEVGVLLL